MHATLLVLLGTAADEHGVVGMGLDVLLEILRALERFAAEIALVRLERHMDADVGGDVVALDRRGAALIPLASEVQVVGAFTAYMLLTYVLLLLLAIRIAIFKFDFKNRG